MGDYVVSVRHIDARHVYSAIAAEARMTEDGLVFTGTPQAQAEASTAMAAMVGALAAVRIPAASEPSERSA